MYQNDSFYIGDYSRIKIFTPVVTSAFKILADNSYRHICSDDEKLGHPKKTIAFIRCTNGSGIIQLNNKKLFINKDECIFIKFNDIIMYKSNSNVWGYRWVNFYADNTNNEFELNKTYRIPFSENEDKCFNKLLAAGKSDINNNSYLSSLFTDYFYSIILENNLNKDELLLNAGKKLTDEICAYINQKLYSKITINEIAAFFNISSRRLHQIFTSELNISPKKYIIKKKMEEGYKLLVQTPVPINKIAYMLCFSSPYHFTNEFKKIFGQSPTEVRKMEQNSH